MFYQKRLIEWLSERNCFDSRFCVISKHFIIFHKFHQVDMPDTVSVLQYIIGSHNVFRIIIPYLFKRRIFSVFRCPAFVDSICHLYIRIVKITVPENKITLKFSYSSDTYRVILAAGIHINNIFKCRTVVDSVIGIAGKVK